MLMLHISDPFSTTVFDFGNQKPAPTADPFGLSGFESSNSSSSNSNSNNTPNLLDF